MATVDEIATLRRYVAEPDETDWTDETLGAIIDASDSLNAAALEVWDSKAATLAALVDISEGGSSRKNSDLAKNALLMRGLFAKRIDDARDLTRGTLIKRLAR
jgi:hypothetical protein